MDTKKLAALAAAVRAGQLHPRGGGAGLHPVRPDPHDEQSGKGCGLPRAGAQPQRCAPDPRGPAYLPAGAGVFGGGRRRWSTRSCSSTPTKRRASAWRPTTPSHATGLPEVIQQFRRNQPRHRRGHPDGQRTGGLPLGTGGPRGPVLRQPSGKRGAGLDTHADDELLAILPPDYDNGGRSAFPVEEFAGKEFLMPSMGFTLDIMRVLNRHGVTPADPHYPSVGQRHPLHGRARPGRQYAVAPGAAMDVRTAYRPCRWPRGPSASWAWPPVPAGSCVHGPAVHGRSAGNERENVTFVRILCWNFRN